MRKQRMIIDCSMADILHRKGGYLWESVDVTKPRACHFDAANSPSVSKQTNERHPGGRCPPEAHFTF